MQVKDLKEVLANIPDDINIELEYLHYPFAGKDEETVETDSAVSTRVEKDILIISAVEE